jgi:hypothetical protein
MELVVRHQTTYLYATPAGQVALLLRLRPGLLDGQKPLQWSVTVNGAGVEGSRPTLMATRRRSSRCAARWPKW